MICKLCKIKEQKEFIILENDLAISFLSNAPLSEEHVMVLPKRHILYPEATKDEHQALAEIISQLNEKLKQLHPKKQPILISVTDTNHSSIPDHVHFHLIPSKYTIRQLIARTHGVEERKEISEELLRSRSINLRKYIFNK